jgi:chromosome partitioning protein
VMETSVPGVWAIPSTIDLAGAEIELVGQISRENRLARAIEPLVGTYDIVLLDCPPSLGLLTVNALSAAHELIVPIQCEYYALEGLGQLLRNVRLIQQNLNPDLRLTGIVLTMYDARTKLSEQVVAEVRRYFGPRVYDTIIPRTVRLSEAPGFGKPITEYDSTSKGARAYRALAVEFLEREAVDEPLPTEEPPSVIAVTAEPGSEDDDEGGEEA